MTGAIEDAVFNKLIDSSPMPLKGKRGRKAPAAAKPPRPGVVVQPHNIGEILRRLDDLADRLLVVMTAFTDMRCAASWSLHSKRSERHEI